MLEKKNKISKKLGIMLLALTLVLGNVAVVGAKTIKDKFNNITYTFQGTYSKNIVDGYTDANINLNRDSNYTLIAVQHNYQNLKRKKECKRKVTIKNWYAGKRDGLRIQHGFSSNGTSSFAYTVY